LDESWFREVLERDDFDMILVVITTTEHPLPKEHEKTILNKIRVHCSNKRKQTIPVQFISATATLDDSSNPIEEELDDKAASSIDVGSGSDSTFGFVSVDVQNKKGSKSFHHTLFTGNKETFAESLGDIDYMTDGGEALEEYIKNTIQALGGNEIIGCSPQRYRATNDETSEDSLLSLYMNRVVSEELLQHLDNDNTYDNRNRFLSLKYNDDDKENIIEKVVEKAEEKGKEKIEVIIDKNDDDKEQEKKDKKIERKEEENHNRIFLQRIDQGYNLKDDIFLGNITLNEVYTSIIPRDDTIQKVIPHSIKGEIIEHLLKKSLAGKKTPMYAHNTDITLKMDGTTSYELYAPTKEVPMILKYLKECDNVEIINNNKKDKLLVKDYKDNPVTLRQIWIDFMSKEWTYDEEEGCSLSKKDSSSSSSKSSKATKNNNDNNNSNKPQQEVSNSQTTDTATTDTKKGRFPWFLIILGCFAYLVYKYRTQGQLPSDVFSDIMNSTMFSSITSYFAGGVYNSNRFSRSNAYNGRFGAGEGFQGNNVHSSTPQQPTTNSSFPSSFYNNNGYQDPNTTNTTTTTTNSNQPHNNQQPYQQGGYQNTNTTNGFQMNV